MNAHGAQLMWMIPHHVAVNNYLMYQQAIAQNAGLQNDLDQIRADHAMVMDQLERAHAREAQWREQVRALREEIRCLRMRIQGGQLYKLAGEQKKVLKALLEKLQPLSNELWLNNDEVPIPNPFLDISYQAMMDRREYRKLVQVYLDTCRHF